MRNYTKPLDYTKQTAHIFSPSYKGPIGKSGPRPELRKLCHGVGINDVMIPYFTRSRVWKKWNDMLCRCYSRSTPRQRLKYYSYEGCTVDKRWHKLSVFKAWLEQWEDYENKDLDKDILIPGNKVYGPDTCLVVRPIVNAWFKPTVTGEFPRGVCRNSHYKFGNGSRPFRAQITPLTTGKRTNLGFFLTPEEASVCFEKVRREQLLILAEEETDPIVKEALLRYQLNE